MSKRNEPITKDGVYHCPVCNSKRITEVLQAALQKYKDINTGQDVDRHTGKVGKLSNRAKAAEYERASSEGVGCWYYSCRKCGWESDLFTE